MHPITKTKVLALNLNIVYVDQFNHDGGTGTYKLDVNNLAKGVYFLHLNSENGQSVQKIVVR